MQSWDTLSVILIVVIGLCLAGSMVIFLRGFQIYQEYRVVEDTPEVPIRSVAMGRVRVHGKALGEKHAYSPVSRSPCFYYKVEIEAWGSHREYKFGKQQTEAWSKFVIDEVVVDFYLEDATGQVRVSPTGVEGDLLLNADRKVVCGFSKLCRDLVRWATRAPAPTGPTDDELLAYACSHVSHKGTMHGCRLKEYCVLPDHWYDLTGTCMENPTARDSHDRNMIKKGTEEPTFLISWRTPRAAEIRLRFRAAVHILCGGALIVCTVAVLLWRLGWL